MINLLAFLLLLNQCNIDTDLEKKFLNSELQGILNSMSLEEKVGQMTMICLSEVTLNGNKELILNEDKLRHLLQEKHIGSFLSATGKAEDWLKFNRRISEIALEESESKIPVVIGIDHIHGSNYIDEGTFFPHNLLLSCSFDTGLVSLTAGQTARETSSVGLLWNFAPVLDLGRNQWWPRFYETFGEDPFLCSNMGKAYIRAYQSNQGPSGQRSAACAKHFIGYSDPKSGWDRTPAEIPMQVLREYFLPPFRTAIDQGVEAIMLNSGELNGEPVHLSKSLVSGILRNELGFEGVIITDIKDILKLVEMHHAAASLEEAVVLALNAGIDISMSCNDTRFADIIIEKVHAGEISESRINESVVRILNMKYKLGLFNLNLPGDMDSIRTVFGTTGSELALEACTGSMVLLKNNGVLPLKKGKKILLAGPAAESKGILHGAWTLEWSGAGEDRFRKEIPNLKEAMETEFGEDEIVSCSEQVLQKKFMVNTATEVIVVCMSEEPYAEFKGNLVYPYFDQQQIEFARQALHTGKPVVLVLLSGRPLLIPQDVIEGVSAILFAGLPGQAGAEAIAGLLSGRFNPSGKLSFTYPASSVHTTNYYRKPSESAYELFEFGHGLSYNTYSYSDLFVNDTLVDITDTLKIRVRLTNNGYFEGKETVLCFVTDCNGAITRPVKKLSAFSKVNLQPGESRLVSFNVKISEHFTFPDEYGNVIAEAGLHKLSIGGLSREIFFTGHKKNQPFRTGLK